MTIVTELGLIQCLVLRSTILIAFGALEEMIHLAPDKRKINGIESLKDPAANPGSISYRTAYGRIHQDQPRWTLPGSAQVGAQRFRTS